jgi:dipeptidyl aminopeptidase/acylaminoacyl peptidase
VDARVLLTHVFAPNADPYGRDILCASLGATTPEEILATRAADVEALSALPALRKLRAPVALLHGAADDVIPPSESVRAAQILERAGIPCRLAITTLVDHGTPDSPWTRPREVAKVAAVTASWFAALRGRHPARVPVRTSATSATRHQVASSTTNGQ